MHNGGVRRVACAFAWAAILLAAVPAASRGQGEALNPAKLPLSLKNYPPLEPTDLNEYIRDREAAIALGKAFYWDMQAGSDGVTACASCHFHAGSDSRTKNQVNPGPNGAFQAHQVNGSMTFADYPLRKLSDPDDANSPVVWFSDDAVGSQGVLLGDSAGLAYGRGREHGAGAADPTFNVGGVNARQATGRNTPSSINAAHNFANFFDGRANFWFNGVNPFGPLDQDVGVWVAQGGIVSKQKVRLAFSSLASQACGPPMSDVEMMLRGRPFAMMGRKLLHLRPLARQMVHPHDSVLGGLARSRLAGGQVVGNTGLNTTYAALIRQAFQPKFWDSSKILRHVGNSVLVIDRPAGTLAQDELTLMEANFTLFWGLALQMFENTLTSDDAPYDRWREGQTDALTAEQVHGLEIFFGKGNCFGCHVGSEFTSASARLLLGLIVDAFEPEFEVIGSLSGAAVTPPVATQAVGSVTAAFEGLLNRLTITVIAQDLVGPTAFLVRHGKVGQGGPVLFTIELPPEVTANPFSRSSRVLVPADLQPAPGVATWEDAMREVQEARTHIVVCTEAFPGGEIAGDLERLPTGVGAIEVMQMRNGVARYDTGFYNVGTRPSAWDVGRGADSPYVNPVTGQPYPLSTTLLAMLKDQGLLPPDVAQYTVNLPQFAVSTTRPAVFGAFKVPSLRNVELTGPYFHNGGQATLRQMLDFYDRGSDFMAENFEDIPPAITILNLTLDEKNAVISFLLALTDERVRQEQAPFDHPQLFIPHGLRGDHTAVTGTTDVLADDFQDNEDVMELPAVGAGGRPASGLPPIERFLNLDPYAP
jgi:cytochrome c peroxidase